MRGARVRRCEGDGATGGETLPILEDPLTLHTYERAVDLYRAPLEKT